MSSTGPVPSLGVDQGKPVTCEEGAKCLRSGQRGTGGRSPHGRRRGHRKCLNDSQWWTTVTLVVAAPVTEEKAHDYVL